MKSSGSQNGFGMQASFLRPYSIYVNWTSTITADGIVPYSAIYVAELYEYCIRVINATNYVSNFAGNCGVSGDINGNLITSRFGIIRDITKGPENSLILADASFNKIKKINFTTG